MDNAKSVSVPSVKRLTPEQREAMRRFEQAVREDAIPRIVRAMRERQVAAARARHRIIYGDR